MPYGTAPLADEELRILASWVAQGAPAPAAAPPPARDADVEVWEAFLNGPSLKERIAARYLYEHWFVAHLVFEGRPAGPFFRVVRSRTAPGEPIDEIATVRPFDDPGATFWYRLRPIDETIVHKTHIVYALGPARLARLRQLFLGADWQPTRFPSYAPEEASNPFVAFAELPAKSRYQFLLDDAHYFVMTFIRGPVCRGQVAVDVIEDQFWIAFLDPDRDPSVTNPAFLAKTAKLLDLPAEHQSRTLPGELWLEYSLKQRKYLDEREAFYDALDPQRRGPALDWIWDGDGNNRNALLTVFRNFDNATVVKGFVGEIPKTAWIMDYPIFERIYYDLVAGYDVFGNVGHQVSTRLYMDHLRMQSENLFLAFLPADRRQAIRASWYVGATRSLDYRLVDSLHALDHGTQVRFTGSDVKAELLEQIESRSPAVAGPPDLLNRCAHPPCDRAGATPRELAVERELHRLAALKGPWVQLLPEVSLLRVRASDRRAGSRLLPRPQRRAHERRVHVRRSGAPAARGRHADRGARPLRQLPELLLRRPRRPDRRVRRRAARARERRRPRALRRPLRHPPHGPALLGHLGLAARGPAPRGARPSSGSTTSGATGTSRRPAPARAGARSRARARSPCAHTRAGPASTPGGSRSGSRAPGRPRPQPT